MYLGIDIGTSSVKTILLDEYQNIVESVSCSLTVSRPKTGYSEQDPEQWIKATAATLDSIKKTHSKQLSAVEGIGLSGQMHGATLIDKHDKVIRPCLLWNDTRSHTEAKTLDDNPIFREITGNIVFPGFTAPKVKWIENNEAECFSKVSRILLPKDYVRLWLTGEYVTDMSDASGTSWFDVKSRKWSTDLLDVCHLDENKLPRLCEGTEISGQIKTKHQQRWGFKKTPIVAGGAGDNAASACGLGIIENGSAFISLGTSGVLFAANNKYSPNPENAVHAFCHAISNTWHQMGVTLSATDSLNWYSSITGKTVETLIKELGNKLFGPSEVCFLPYLAGERTPHNDTTIRGAFVGISHHSDQKQMTKAVLEGVAFAFRDNLSALESAGTHIESLKAVGGGSKSRYWLKILSTVLDISIDMPAAANEGAAFGAARLALIASTGASPAEICSTQDILETIEPNAKLHNKFEDSYQKYKKLYYAFKS